MWPATSTEARKMKKFRKLIGRGSGDHDPVTWFSSRVVVIFVASFFVPLESMVIRENPVRLRVLEYSSKNGSLSKVLNSRYSDLVIGEEVDEGSQLVLECSSSFGPLRWIYSGVGHPDHKSYYTSRTRSDSSYYTAYLSFPSGLTLKETGQYSCQNSYNSSLSNYVYLFVPKKNLNGKPSLFVPTEKKQDVVISAGQKTARIPCGVVHPNVKVSLERVSPQKSFWLEPPTQVPYNPKSGFTVPVSPTTKEIYTCRGELNGQFEEVTFVTSPLQPRIDPEVELLHDVLLHNQHRHRQNSTTFATTTTPEPTITATTPSKLPTPENLLVSACTPQFCGSNAECIVKDYKPYCVCFEDYTGNPKTSCHKISDHSQHLRVEDPCHPSPCGKHSECLQINGHPLCTCLEGYYGSPPKCSPHKFQNCSKNYDCEWTEYCNTETKKCENICEGSMKFCGKNAMCTAFSHMPYCACSPGGLYVGDPYDTEGAGCQLQTEKAHAEGKPSCNPSPCGRNAHCKVYSSYPLPICFCPQGFTGDPSHRCYKLSPAPIIDVFRPHYNTHPPLSPTTTIETTTNSPTNFLPPSAAASTLLIHHHHHPNPQPVTLCTQNFCGENARCRFRNNHPECHCLSGYKGDPYKGCHRQAISPIALRQACSVCGPNSVCSMISSDVRCICAPDSVPGTSPPNCRKAHSSISTTSSTSSHSQQQQQHLQVSVISTSHTSSPFSPASVAHQIHQLHQQQQKHHLQKISLSFHPACISDLDCPNDLVCYTPKKKCLNPCSWACSDSSSCIIVNHQVQCCPPGFEADPIQCTRVSHTNQPPQSQGDKQQTLFKDHLCGVNCGPNTVCRRIPPTEMRQLRRNTGSLHPFLKISISNGYFTDCACRYGFRGNPYSIEGCSFDNRSSSSNNVNISSTGSDNKIFSDDLDQLPFPSSTSTIVIHTDPCNNSPCGPHSLCVAHMGQAFCRCDFDSVGEPPNCKLRCSKSQHCLFDEVCLFGKCVAEVAAPSSMEILKQQQHQQSALHSEKNQFDSNNFLK